MLTLMPKLLLFILATCLQLSGSDAICPSRQVQTFKCHDQSRSSHKHCKPYSLQSQHSRKGAFVTLIKLPQNTSCAIDELSVTDDFTADLNNPDALVKWRINLAAIQGTKAPSFLLLQSSNETSFQEEKAVTDSILRLLSYVTHDVSIQFYKADPNQNLSRRATAQLIPEKSSAHNVQIFFNMSGDRGFEQYALQRQSLLSGSVRLYCVQKQQGNEGMWTQNGCRTDNATVVNVTCDCDVQGEIESSVIGVMTTVEALPGSQPAMPVYFSLTLISTCFFLLTLCLLLRFGKALRDPNRRFEVQLNLTVSLLLRHTFLLIGFGISLFSPLNRHGCEALAVLHMYFLITSVLWVLVEGVIIYRKVCKSSLTQPLRNVIATMFLVWGAPFILLAAVSSVELKNDRFIRASTSYSIIEQRLRSVFSNPEIIHAELGKYRKYDACWTTSKLASLSIGIPVTISLVVNTIILIWVGIVVWRIRGVDQKNTPLALRTDNGTHRQTISTFRAVVILTAVLGIPWLFSLFYNLVEGIEKKFSLAPSYIHFVCVFLQGPALFYLYCVHNNEFRRAVRRQVNANKIKNSILSQNRLQSNSAA